VVAFVPGSAGAGASILAVGLAVAARRQGLSTLLVGADPGGRHVELVAGSPGAGGSLAVLDLDRWDGASVPPDAMAAALRAARHGRDLVVVDLPRVLDDAARLALTCADRCYIVVTGEIRACAAAGRVVAAVRRHCPGTSLVVRAMVPGGLRAAEVAEALALPLAGVLPAAPTVDPSVPGRPSSNASALRAVSGLSRRLLADSGARRRAVDLPVWPEPAAAFTGVDR
jgi:septum formation inhibitor-activating ATPase MinD